MYTLQIASTLSGKSEIYDFYFVTRFDGSKSSKMLDKKSKVYFLIQDNVPSIINIQNIYFLK